MKDESTMKNKEEDWLQSHWRPLVAIAYLAIILFDFIVAPSIWALIQAYSLEGAQGLTQWEPLTLSSGGIFHVAMGGVLGISAWTRGLDKINNQHTKG